MSGHHNFIYAFYDTVVEVHGSNRGKSVIALIKGEVLTPPATGNNILLHGDVKFRFSMLYLILTLMFGVGH